MGFPSQFREGLMSQGIYFGVPGLKKKLRVTREGKSFPWPGKGRRGVLEKNKRKFFFSQKEGKKRGIKNMGGIFWTQG